jgi:hypothetical protein
VSGSVLRAVTTTDRGATVATAIEAGVTAAFIAARPIDNQPGVYYLDRVLQDIIAAAGQQPGVYDYYMCIADMCGLPSLLSMPDVDPSGSYASALAKFERLSPSPVSVDLEVDAVAADVDDSASAGEALLSIKNNPKTARDPGTPQGAPSRF